MLGRRKNRHLGTLERDSCPRIRRVKVPYAFLCSLDTIVTQIKSRDWVSIVFKPLKCIERTFIRTHASVTIRFSDGLTRCAHSL
jgi:hypothetical protein